MYKTIISHFYNEEYLLPWWLEHHKQYFDHGIMIDYASTDRSVEIIKDICPDWTVIPSRNAAFEAVTIDQEVMDIERGITGWRAALNISEFLVGDYSVLEDTNNTSYIVPCCVMVDNEPQIYPDRAKSLVQQKNFGIHYDEGGSNIRRSRLIHSDPNYVYPLGRHFGEPYTTDKLAVLWYGYSPYNADVVKRKLQIQTKIPASDLAKGYGTQHNTNEEALNNVYQDYLKQSRDLSEESFMIEEK